MKGMGKNLISSLDNWVDRGTIYSKGNKERNMPEKMTITLRYAEFVMFMTKPSRNI